MKKFILLILLCILFSTGNNASAQSKATFYTSMGTFVVDLYDNLQPITAGNFKSLVNAKFYDGIIFHRVINGFMIQGGCPLGNGTGGPGYTIADEFDAATSNVQKAIAMANSGPNTGGSQFFINLVNNTGLDPLHPVFGIVSTNFSVVQSIGAVATNASDKPIVDVVMDSIRITTSPVGIGTELGQNHIQFEIYPNPATSNSILRIQSNAATNIELSVCDLLGNSLFYQKRWIPSGITSISANEILHEGNAAGLYFFVVKSENRLIRQKVLVND